MIREESAGRSPGDDRNSFLFGETARSGSESRLATQLSLSWAAWRKRMLDLIFIILVLFFFALSFWYIVFCERV